MGIVDFRTAMSPWHHTKRTTIVANVRQQDLYFYPTPAAWRRIIVMPRQVCRGTRLAEPVETAYNASPTNVNGDAEAWQLFPADEPPSLGGGRSVVSAPVEPTDVAGL